MILPCEIPQLDIPDVGRNPRFIQTACLTTSSIVMKGGVLDEDFAIATHVAGGRRMHRAQRTLLRAGTSLASTGG